MPRVITRGKPLTCPERCRSCMSLVEFYPEDVIIDDVGHSGDCFICPECSARIKTNSRLWSELFRNKVWELNPD